MSKRTKSTPSLHNVSSRPNLAFAWIALAIVLVFVVAIRIRLLDIPLERDEGEYAYMGQLVLQGVPPYTLAYTMKFPGTALMYAFFMALFGQTTQAIHLGLLFVNIASVVLLFLIGKRLIGELAGVAAAAAFAVLSLNHSVLGFAAHATHYVVLAALAGTLALLVALERNKAPWYLTAGFLFGLAPVMKQPGAFFVLFGLLFLLYHLRAIRPAASWIQTIRALAAYASGAALPLLAVGMWISGAGAFGRFWFWTVTYAREYGTMVPWSEAPSLFTNALFNVADGFSLLWCIAAAGLIALALAPRKPGQRTFLFLFTSCGFLALCPGFYFRQHYFITILPAAALAVGYGVDHAWRTGSAVVWMPYLRYAGIALFTLAVAIGLYTERSYFFMDAPAALSRRFFSYNPFVESVEIAKFIRANSSEPDRIAIFGSEPQIYFYAKRHSATGHIYMYGMMEDHPYSLAMQKEMIREVEAARPRFVVFTSISGSWMQNPKSNRFISTWLGEYWKEHYSLAGVVDILSDNETVYKWHDEAQAYTFQTPRRVYILERTEDSESS